MRSIVVLATSIASFLSVTPRAVHAQAAGPAGSLDAAVVEVMTEWKLPGVVMVVVKDGTVLLNEGYGTRMVGQQLPVNGETLVQVASHTKAVTATALAMLVDAGDIEWDDPIRKHVPEFAVDDQYTTERVTVRDLMAHRGGLPAAALGGFQNADFGLDELLAALRTRQPQPLRARQVYSQPSIALAGEVVGRASGVSWEQFVRDRVFAPLGMTSSYTSTPDLIERVGVPSASSNIMIPARFRDGVVVSGTWSEIGTDRLYAPAGGITTNGADIAKWITALLQDGRYPGGRLLSVEALAETRAALIPLDPALSTFTDPIAPLGTATLGWNAVAYAGHVAYFAPGGWMSSVVALVPAAGVGVGVFTNAYFSERHPFESLFPVYALALVALDSVMEVPPKDWSSVYRAALATVAGPAQ